jgi:hypothetical protein
MIEVKDPVYNVVVYFNGKTFHYSDITWGIMPSGALEIRKDYRFKAYFRENWGLEIED